MKLSMILFYILVILHIAFVNSSANFVFHFHLETQFALYLNGPGMQEELVNEIELVFDLQA